MNPDEVVMHVVDRQRCQVILNLFCLYCMSGQAKSQVEKETKALSTEEQEALIGRLVVERTKAQQQSALLWNEITSMGILCGNISGNLGGRNPDPDAVIGKIEEIQKRGGLEKLRDQINERKSLDARVAEISRTLKSGGAE